MKKITEGIYEALPKPVDNGSTYARPKVGRPKSTKGFSEVLVVRPPVGNWRCDECQELGWGAREMFTHNCNTGHTQFTGDKDGMESL